MARFLLTPFGSAGDVNPHLWLGRLLAARGHEVKVITVPMFRDMVERAGLSFVGIGDEREFESILSDRRLWKPLAGSKLVFERALRAMPLFFEALAEELTRGPAVLVSPFHQFAARAAREKFGVPLVMVHLQPACFLSAWDTPLFFNGTAWINRLPRWLKRFGLTTANPANALLRRGLATFCRRVGIAAPARPLPAWLHSPDANLALFPEWFAEPQPDWPSGTRLTGFPLEDLRGLFALPPELERFLAAGERPVLFSPGTGHAQARAFFAAGLEACRRVGIRALVGTRYRDQLPDPLPDWACAFDYVPFSELLPRVATVVHHGGIGTMSQAFAAGTPQLVMPMAHDQPDNAARMRRLGCGEVLSPRSFTAARVASALERLRAGPAVGEACATVQRRCRAADPSGVALEVLEAAARVFS